VAEAKAGPGGRQFVSIDFSKCIGCGFCEYICAIEKEGFPDPLRSRIRVVRLNPWINVATICRFCDKAPCVTACPRDALKQSDKGGIISVDEAKCDRCAWCIPACQYGGIVLHPTQKVVSCDLCGGEPKCVEFCPEEALELVKDDAASQKMWSSAIENLPPRIDALANMIKKRDWTQLFSEAEKRSMRLEEKLEALKARGEEVKQAKNRPKPKTERDLNSFLQELKESGTVVVYSCPHCRGKLKLSGDSSLKTLKYCKYCGREIETKDLAEIIKTALS
jgi:Fe-S-cluster-containing hydrogenase component 2